MLFTDDDARHSYHKAPALLQVVCQVLEMRFAEHGLQIELVDCEKSGGMWAAALALSDDLAEEAQEHVIAQVNNTFARSDTIPTCAIENAETGLFSVRVTEATDFSMLL